MGSEYFASHQISVYSSHVRKNDLVILHTFDIRSSDFRGNESSKSFLQDLLHSILQGFGSGSGLDPYSIGPVDPDPYSESGSRRAKMTHKSRKNSCFKVLDGLFCELQASSVTWTYLMEA